MITLTKWIVETLFTEEEIKELDNVHYINNKEYLDSLELDPFTYDFTGEELESHIRKILKSKGIKVSKNELKMLVSKVIQYVI